MNKVIKNAKEIQKRSQQLAVEQIGADVFSVASADPAKSPYTVTISRHGGTCNCEWGGYRPKEDKRSGCKHVMAAISFISHSEGRKVSAWASEDQAAKQHRPMIQIGDGVILTTRKFS